MATVQPSLFTQCADIATWTENVAGSADADGSVHPSTAVLSTGTNLLDHARPETSDGLAAAVSALAQPTDVADLYNGAMDQLSAACASTGLGDGFEKIGAAATPSPTPSSPEHYTLSVTGSGSANVVWTTADGSQQHDVTLPWTTTIPDDGTAYYSIVLAGTSTSGSAATIGCSISEDGTTFATNTSSGAYSTVSCSK
ncbi:hypothetical protein [Curtobacterium sp. MCBD17_003]|uniref:hypothetical protein n=1 Tax=Curtobacterium sp. MCBD17_003 TaxID=2175667 RepID=UPI0011B404B4|nr:hypothetical protein [Curtobacterium sp. MCBD17_003]WIE54241.1 hypothetical protein DEI88_014120 [Curtobacterium sp. MCBD17_003]